MEHICKYIWHRRCVKVQTKVKHYNTDRLCIKVQTKVICTTIPPPIKLCWPKIWDKTVTTISSPVSHSIKILSKTNVTFLDWYCIDGVPKTFILASSLFRKYYVCDYGMNIAHYMYLYCIKTWEWNLYKARVNIDQ